MPMNFLKVMELYVKDQCTFFNVNQGPEFWGRGAAIDY